jgi:ligand-binding sensor domain-containing protein
VTDIAFDDQGRVWLTDGRGVDVYDAGELITYDYESGLTSAFTEAVLEDLRGRIWVGITTGEEPAGCIGASGYGGVNLFEDGAWTWMGTEEVFGPSVMDLALDTSGNVWAVGSGGVGVFNGEEWETMTFPDVENMPSANCVATDPSGSTWIGTKQLGVWVWDGTGWTQYTSDDGLAGDTVWTIEFDDAGRTWLGTGTGLSVFDGDTWTNFTTQDGLTYNDVRALALAPDGVWIGTWRGLSRVVFQD